MTHKNAYPGDIWDAATEAWRKAYQMRRVGPANTIAPIADAIWSERQASDTKVVAWTFELAGVHESDSTYSHWGAPQLSFTKPHVPLGSIRNLRPLYATAGVQEITFEMLNDALNVFHKMTGIYITEDEVEAMRAAILAALSGDKQ